MNFLTRQSLFVTIIIAFGSQTVWAHDPAEHAKEAADAKAAAKCESMQKMDMSKMDPKDPVMQAMMQKCAKKPSTGKPKMDHSQMKDMKGMNDMPMKMDHSKMDMDMPVPTPTTK